MIIDCIKILPEHHSLHIYHNMHRDCYESLADYLESPPKNIDPEDRRECLEKDSLWEVHLYPTTPISFYYAAAPTLERAFEIILASMKEDVGTCAVYTGKIPDYPRCDCSTQVRYSEHQGRELDG